MNIKEYAWYIEGNKICVVEKDTAFDNDANSRDYGPGSDRFNYKSPLSFISEGLEILYSYADTLSIVDESSEVNIPNYLSKALIYYVKAQYLEDGGSYEESEYFMAKFTKQIEKYNNALLPGPRMISSGPNAIR